MEPWVCRGQEPPRSHMPRRMTRPQGPALDRLMDGARRPGFEAAVVWSISRFGRSIVGSVLAMQELAELGIRLIVLQAGESLSQVAFEPIRERSHKEPAVQ